jgi:hypothetical protein
MTDEKRARVQGENTDEHGHLMRDAQRNIVRIPAGTISWEEHLEAWEAYANRFGRTYQSAERIDERQGFGFYELCDLLGHKPTTWRPR